MKTVLKFAVVVALFGGVAMAASALIAQDQRIWFKQGFVVVPTAINTQATTAAHVVTRLLAGAETFDFASTTIVCEDSTGATITGAQVGDGCTSSTPVAPGNGTFSCYVSAANTVKGHFCPAGTTVNPASGSFRYYIRSNQ